MYQTRQTYQARHPVPSMGQRQPAPAWLQAINAARANLGAPPLTAAQLDGAWRNNNDQR